jgi:hypothetical protein
MALIVIDPRAGVVVVVEAVTGAVVAGGVVAVVDGVWPG